MMASAVCANLENGQPFLLHDAGAVLPVDFSKANFRYIFDTSQEYPPFYGQSLWDLNAA